jgi:hypothetical protein
LHQAEFCSMRELTILLIVSASVAIVWYVRLRSSMASNDRVIGDPRRTASNAVEPDSLSSSAPRQSADFAPPAVLAGPAERGAGKFQEAAASAAGLQFERAANRMEHLTAELANARRDAERTAEELADNAAAVLAAIQVAAATHGGAVRGEGTDRCPPTYPVKATIEVLRTYLAGQPTYDLTVPDVCLKSAAAAEAVGFSGNENESGATT